MVHKFIPELDELKTSYSDLINILETIITHDIRPGLDYKRYIFQMTNYLSDQFLIFWKIKMDKQSKKKTSWLIKFLL